MTNAAIYWHPDAYDTSGKILMGRHSAGEGFIRGYIRHGVFKELTLWNATAQPPAKLEPLLQKIEPNKKPVKWINRDYRALSQIGVLNLPVPGLGQEAWARRVGDERAYSLCGVTHTIATGRAMDILAEMPIAPVQPWDALVVTSRPALAAIQTQAEAIDDYLRDRLGASRLTRPQYVHIPLGVNSRRFDFAGGERAYWRERLSIEEGDVAVLYFGRFSAIHKMNPVPMMLALEKAAAKTEREVHWILCGKKEDEKDTFEEAILAHNNKVSVHFVDGREEQATTIWAAADIFFSLSDNVQETFGLTPVEAMASGLPCVVSDWDGYKDIVRHGIDGYRIATTTPAAGTGRDLALAFSQEWSTYGAFVGSVAQLTAVDVEQAGSALHELIENADLRKRMGAAGKTRVKEVFDWGNIIPQYEALWGDLNARRRAAPAKPPLSRNLVDNPWRPDPFRFFGAYPTEWLTSTSMLATAGVTPEAAESFIQKPLISRFPHLLPSPEEIRKILTTLSTLGQCQVAELLKDVPVMRRPHMERGLVWMAKYGLITILPRSNLIP